MAEVVEKTIKSTQEQAVASWITYLNQCRLNELIEKLNQQDINLEEALKELDELKRFLGNPTHILGSPSTKHGEIAEHMQVNFSNARQAIQGLAKNHTFDCVGRTAPEDYIRDGQQVQSKFYNGLRNTFFGQHALSEHLDTYPDFVKNGGSYDIPRDQYDKLVDILDKYKNNPSELNTSDFNLAKKIDEFLNTNNLEMGKDINPAVVDYGEVQQGTANQTLANEENNIKEEDKKQRDKAHQESKPSLKEGAKAVGIGAAVEGGVTFCMSVAKKRKEKAFSEFTSEDWKDIGVDTGTGTVKGGIRGGVIYVLTNFTATPSNIASAYVTASFGIASQIRALENGKVSPEDFVINCETVCLDATVSAIASLAGELIIPVPILGAVIGNVVGSFVYEICKNQGSLYSEKLIAGYKNEMEQLNQTLDIQFLKVVMEIQKRLERFHSLEELAFDENVNIAFNGSIDLALELGVDESKILKSKDDIDNYFLV